VLKSFILYCEDHTFSQMCSKNLFLKILKVSICFPQGFPAEWRFRWLSG